MHASMDVFCEGMHRGGSPVGEWAVYHINLALSLSLSLSLHTKIHKCWYVLEAAMTVAFKHMPM